MRIVMNSREHQIKSGYAYRMFVSTHPHDEYLLHFAVQGRIGRAHEKVNLAVVPYQVSGAPGNSNFSEADQACFEEWFARNADVLVEAYRSARIFDYEQAFD